MLKNIIEMQTKIDENVFQLLFDSGSKIQDIKEALFYFQKMIGRLEDQWIEQNKKNESEQNEEVKDG